MKKSIALILSIFTAMSLFSGCGEQKNVNPVGEMSKEEIIKFESQAGGLKLPLDNKGTPIVIWTESSNTGMTDTVVIKELSRRTGADISILEVPAASAANKAKTILASKKDIPDIMGTGLETEELNDLGIQGAFVAINKYIDELPNFKHMFVDNAKEYKTEKVMNSWKAPDGNLYRFPNYGINRDVNHGILYRKDIFDKHGLEMWNSPETFYQTLKKLKELYPDSTPWVSKTKMTFFNNIFASWGIQGWPDAYYDATTDKWKSSATDPLFREFLAFIKKCYSEGLLDPEFLTSTEAAWASKMTSKDKAFITYDWIGRLDMYKEQTLDTVPEYDLRYGNPVGPTQKVITLSTCGGGFATKSGENELLALKINDYLLSEGGAELMTCGIEGVTFNWSEDGKKAEYIGFEEGKAIGIKDLEEKYGMCLSGVVRRYDKKCVYFNYTEKEQEAQDLMNNKEGGGYLTEHPELTFTDAESKVLSEYEPKLRTIAEEYTFNYILSGDPNNDGWDKFVDDMNKNGLGEVLKVYNQAHSRYGK